MSTQSPESNEAERKGRANDIDSDRCSDDNTPIPPYRRAYNDRADSYCCSSMEDEVEGGLDGRSLGYLQYDDWVKDFVLVHPSGHPVACLQYCPWCGAYIGASRELYHDKYFEYVRKGPIKTFEEFHKRWPIISRGLDQEETMRLIAEERAKEEAKKGMGKEEDT